jgi:CHAD domain-containing protein
MREHLEIERKYDADACLGLPSLNDVPGVSEVRGPELRELQAVYFDTEDLRLLRRQVTLRRREGGPDAGWHLKRPTPGGGRLELHAPLDAEPADAVPAELASQVASISRGGRLVPVVRMSTRRLVHHLYGPHGGQDGQPVQLAELVEDEVVAETLGPHGGQTSSWSEIEVELVDGDLTLLDAVERRLLAAGARPAQQASKLARVLGARLPTSPTRPLRTRLTPDSPGGEVVTAYLVEQVRRLVDHDPGARQQAPDAVHQMRVAARRLRSVVGSYTPLFDEAAATRLREELAWLGNQLGPLRDLEVLADLTRRQLAEQPPELLVGPVTRRLSLEMDARIRPARERALATLDEPRYFALLDTAETFAVTPPWTAAAAQPAAEVLPPLLAGTVRRVRRRAARAGAPGPAGAAPGGPDHQQLAWHAVRRAAKQARYAAETVEVVLGRPAGRLAEAMRRVQDLLGDQRDATIATGLLREIGMSAYGAGENAFTWGRLHAQMEARACGLLEQAGPAVSEALRKRRLSWLTGR